jgi:hypothetical protein
MSMRGYLLGFGAMQAGVFTEKAFVLAGWPDKTVLPLIITGVCAVVAVLIAEAIDDRTNGHTRRPVA